MQLATIKLSNFRKFNDLEINFQNQKNEIQRPNRWGKSTVADAIAFVLVGKLNNGSSDLSSIKPISNAAKKPIERLETAAELVFLSKEDELGRARTITLKKEYGEQWVRTRGTDTLELKGHFTNFYINDIKKSATEYSDEIIKLFNVPDMEYLQILINPTYFSQIMTWQKRRDVVNKLVGDITIDEVLKEAPFLRKIETEIINAGNADDAIKSLKLKLVDNKGFGLNKDVADLKAKVEGTVSNESIKLADKQASQRKIKENLEKIVDLRVAAKGTVNPTVDRLKTELQANRDLLSKSQQADNAELQQKNESFVNQISRLKEEKTVIESNIREENIQSNFIERQIKNTEEIIDTKRQTITRKDAQRSLKRHEWYDENKKTFTPKDEEKCPNCGFDLTHNENDESEKRFNLQKATRLTEITNQGLELKKEVDQLEQEIKNHETEIAGFKAQLKGYDSSKAEAEIQRIANEILELENKKSYFYESNETKKLKNAIEETQKSIEIEQNKVSDGANTLVELEKLTKENDDLQTIVDKYNQQELDRERSREWETQISIKTKAIAEIETKIDLLKAFRRTRIDLLKTKISMVFGNIEFNLIQENIKADSWDEVCYVMDTTENGLVPYEYTNTERKIKIGIQIIEAIKNALGSESAPIIIDNAEAMTTNNRTFKTKAQTICMIAEEA